MSIEMLSPIVGTETILLLQGSMRSNANVHGLSSFLVDRFKRLMSDPGTPSGASYTLVPAQELMPRGQNLPTAEVSEAVIPVSVVDQEDYSDPEVKSFSRLVRSSRAVVVLTPQFNRGYPGNLKNLLDHLYHEWRSKPFLVFTYGGHGGGSCAQQLLTVLQAGLKAQVVSDPVAITLPEEYIRGDNRVPLARPDQPEDDPQRLPPFLQESVQDVDTSLLALLHHLQQRQGAE